MEVKALAVPSGIKVGVDPVDVLEAKVMTTKPSVYVTDSKGKMLTELGDPSDPWKCTVSLVSGAGTLGGNVTVPFIKGVAEFNDLFVTQMGQDFILEFAVTYPPEANLPSVQGLPFEVGPRPLGLRFWDETILRKENTTFDVIVKIWDEALDEPALRKSTLATFNWDCSIYLSAGEGNLTGNTNFNITAGKNTAVFSDLILTAAGLYFDLEASCSSVEAGVTVSAKTAPFHVHDYPQTGLLRKTATQFKYSGPFAQIDKIIKAYTSGIVNIDTCQGCPDGLVSKKSVKPPSGEVELLNWSPCDYPIFLGSEGSCTS